MVLGRPDAETVSREVLRAFAGRVPGIADLPAKRPEHAAIARVWLLGDEWVLRARTLGPSTHGDFGRELGLVHRARPLLPWCLPMPVTTDDGRPCVVDRDSLWTLHRRIPGRVLCPWQELHRASDGDRRRLVEALKDLHVSTTGRFEPDDSGWFVREIGRRSAEVKNLLTPFAWRRFGQRLDRHRDVARRLESHGTAFVHGDFHWGNLLVDDAGNISGMVDLDWCRVGSPLEDLGYTAMMLGRDCETGRFAPEALDDAARWYGLPESLRDGFVSACTLYAVFDVHLFREARDLPDRRRYLDVQVGMAEAICRWE
jgi:aminoglycoside phosphotransferase (APT) family kinase protein